MNDDDENKNWFRGVVVTCTYYDEIISRDQNEWMRKMLGDWEDKSANKYSEAAD